MVNWLGIVSRMLPSRLLRGEFNIESGLSETVFKEAAGSFYFGNGISEASHNLKL